MVVEYSKKAWPAVEVCKLYSEGPDLLTYVVYAAAVQLVVVGNQWAGFDAGAG